MEGAYQPTGLNMRRLLLSIVFSLAIWWWLFGSGLLAIVLIFSILVHEYGHYWWMGEEGLESRDMMMIPPFGALATWKEHLPGFGAEGRLALAGPVVGLIPGFIFVVLYLLLGQPMWAFAAVLVGAINLFNLLPVLPLDGGRIVRSVLASIHPALEFVCVFATPVLVGWAIFHIPGFLIFGLFILFIWLSVFFNYRGRQASGRLMERMSFREIAAVVSVLAIVVALHLGLIVFGTLALESAGVSASVFDVSTAVPLFPW